MEILKNFGFDPVLLAAQIINFLIIFYLLKRFMYKPVLLMLKKRQEAIVEGLKQAEEAKIALEKTLENEKKILAKAQDEAKKILDDAKEQSLEVSRQIEQKTKSQTEKMILEARVKIDADSKEMERRLMQNITIIASGMLAKTLEKTFGSKEQKQVINKALKVIEKIN